MHKGVAEASIDRTTTLPQEAVGHGQHGGDAQDLVGTVEVAARNHHLRDEHWLGGVFLRMGRREIVRAERQRETDTARR